ncbi:MAG: hypothetical protein QG558_1513, partial [Campylobacterota bacterium]|nr:hypothetical protein [Campylobacterota bacterium]
MKRKFLGSVVAAALMSTTVMAEGTMFQRFEAMEKEMNALKTELAKMKAEKAAPVVAKKATVDDDDDEKPAKATARKVKVAVSKDDDEKSVPEQLEDIHDQLSTLNKRTNGNNLKFGVDFRTSYDDLQYKMADGSKQKNDALFTNRLWLNMNYAATKNLSFTGQLAFNKIFGERSMASSSASAPFDGFDWVSNESAYNDELRVRSAYFYYQDDEFLGTDVPWTISIGRRPSTQGHLISMRDNDEASSPLAHTVNVEFDGASAKFGMEEITGLDGSYFKLCGGRGMSNAEARFDSAPYSSKDSQTNNIDMVGIIVVPYDDKQFSTGFQYTYANNLIDMVNGTNPNLGMESVG